MPTENCKGGFFQRVDPVKCKRSDSEPTKYNQYRKISLAKLDVKYKLIVFKCLNAEENYLANI